MATPQPSPHKAVAQRPPCHQSLASTEYAFYSYVHQPPMKAAREVRCRRQPVRWRRSCCVGERPLCRQRPRNPPPTKPSRSDRQRPPTHQTQKGSHHAQRWTQTRRRRSQGQHERPQVRTLLAALQRRQRLPCPSTRRSRPTSPHSVVSSSAPSAWPPGRRTRPCWRSSSVPPPGATPSSPICERHPLGQPAQQGTQTAVNQRRIIHQLRQERLRRETIAVLPPGQLQKTTKNTKQSYKGRLIIWHFCSPRRPSSPTTCSSPV